jgi:AhpD family alkylhydroperoxidase
MSLSDFREFRERMNERILGAGNLDINRFFALDSRVYGDGALPAATKELLGLVASLVLRCDDCITYHMVRCVEEGLEDEEIVETMAKGVPSFRAFFYIGRVMSQPFEEWYRANWTCRVADPLPR